MPETCSLRSQRECDALVLQYQYLPWHIAKKMMRNHSRVRLMGLEDAASAGMVGLVVAARRYDPSLGFQFSS